MVRIERLFRRGFGIQEALFKAGEHCANEAASHANCTEQGWVGWKIFLRWRLAWPEDQSQNSPEAPNLSIKTPFLACRPELHFKTRTKAQAHRS